MKNKLEKPGLKFNGGITTIFSLLCLIAFYLFPDTWDILVKIIIILGIITLASIIIFVVEILELNKFYSEYEKQYDHLSDLFETYKETIEDLNNELRNNDSKKTDKNLKNIIDNLNNKIIEIDNKILPTEIVDNW